jgi:hypothetical protein
MAAARARGDTALRSAGGFMPRAGGNAPASGDGTADALRPMHGTEIRIAVNMEIVCWLKSFAK